jgi:HD-GYP domain-containing protein (c-di-GMP phosphodiesterase class II)
MTERREKTRSDRSLLPARLREAGVLLIHCDASGGLQGVPPRGRDWLADLICVPRLVRRAIEGAAAVWESEGEPRRYEAMPGLWLYPQRQMSRRQNLGYTLAVLVTDRFITEAPLEALCQSAKLDLDLTRRMLYRLPPVAPQDLDRLGLLVHDAQARQQRLGEAEGSMESVSQQLAESYEELTLLYTMSQNMTIVDRPEHFVDIACQELIDTLPYAWVAAVFSDVRSELKRLAGQYIEVGEASGDKGGRRALARQLLDAAEPHTPMVLEPSARAEHESYRPLGRSVVAQPITRDGAVLGLLLAGEKQGEDTIVSSVDIKLLEATANHTSIFIENAALYENLNAMFLGTLEALTTAIDAKDRYTCGHSQRVAQLTRQLAVAVGLDEHAVSRMWIAALVHDIGKIGVPESVLTKPGRLTDEEFDEIKKHPEIGHRILKDIPQLKDILPGVLHHHERWDGRGYPHGLSGEGIPLMARLIALADSFDAMSSDRTYRQRLSRSDVLEEIRRCAGGQFDPELAPIFVGLDFSAFDELIDEHGAREPIVQPGHRGGRAA